MQACGYNVSTGSHHDPSIRPLLASSPALRLRRPSRDGHLTKSNQQPSDGNTNKTGPTTATKNFPIVSPGNAAFMAAVTKGAMLLPAGTNIRVGLAALQMPIDLYK